MSASKSKPITGASSVSKVKAGSGGTTSSKTNPPGKSKEQSHAPVSIVKDSVTASSTNGKPSEFYISCRNNEIDAVNSLLSRMTLEEINQIEPNGSTALHAAAYYGNEKVVKLLLSKGAQRMIKNRYACTPYDEAKTEKIKKLFERLDGSRTESSGRFVSEKGPSFEWIFVKSDPSSYAQFNRQSLLKCRTDEEFDRLCRGIEHHYINQDGPLADVEHIEAVRLLIARAIKENDPTQVVRAYTAETGFYRRLNTDLAQMPTHWSGRKHERNIASIMLFHPVFQQFSFTGESFRGMTMSSNDLKEYTLHSVFMNKTFLSTSKERTRAESFATPAKSSAVCAVVCKYLIKHSGTALAIEEISEYPLEKEVLILPYASFKVKSIRKASGSAGLITEIDVEEEDPVKWTLKQSHQTSQTHTSLKKKSSANQGDDNDSYAKMFQDSQEKGKIDPADLAKWKQQSFGIDPATDTYAKMWNDAKKGKFSKSDVAKWKKENGLVTNDNDHIDSDLESYDSENDPTVFTASNEQSYATSKKFTSKEPFHMKQFLTKFENDSDD